MNAEEQEIISRLRGLARRGKSPSDIVRELVQLGAGKTHTLDAIRYMREAFHLTLQQVAPIAGWMSAGQEKMQDSQLDECLLPEILRNRPQWDKQEHESATAN
jgi:hypothetical protein